MHIDPRHLDAMKNPFGKRTVLQMIYHEAGHAAAGWNHERTADYTTDSLYAVAGYPDSPYFRSVNSVGGGACFQ